MTPASGPPELQSADLASGSGARLREAREARQMDVVQIANELRLSARNIEALEAENLSQLPEPSYICGYLRAYAKLMDLPPEEILDNFPGVRGYLASVKSTVMPTRMVVASEESSRQAPLPGFTPANVIMVVAAAVVAVVLIVQLRNGDNAALTSLPQANAPVVESQAPAAGASVDSTPAEPAPAESPRVSTAPETVALPLPAVTSTTQATPVAVEPAKPEDVLSAPATPEPSAAPTAPTAPTASSPAPGTSQLVLEFRGESWLEVHDANNKRLARELVPAGETRTLGGAAPFNVVLGAGSQVDIRYNDVVYDMRRYVRAKMVILTIGKAEDNRSSNPVN